MLHRFHFFFVYLVFLKVILHVDLNLSFFHDVVEIATDDSTPGGGDALALRVGVERRGGDGLVGVGSGLGID